MTSTFFACLDQVPHDRSNCADGYYDFEGAELHVAAISETFLGCHTIPGSLRISGDVDNVRVLRGITHIQGDLTIQATSVESLEGLEQLERIDGYLRVEANTGLRTLDLPALQDVRGVLVRNNRWLRTISGLGSLQRIRADEGVGILVERNDSLASLGEFERLEESGSIAILANPNLQAIEGFAALTEIRGDPALHVGNSPSLSRLDGFHNVTTLDGGLILHTLVDLRRANVFGSRPSGVRNLRLWEVNMPYCEVLALRDQLRPATTDISHPDPRCSVELQPVGRTLRPGEPFDLTWSVHGFLDAITQTIEVGTDLSNPSERIEVGGFRRIESFTAPVEEGRYDYRIVVSNARISVSAFTSVDVAADRPPVFTVNSSSIAAGFAVDVEIVASDPDGDMVSFEVDTTPTAGTFDDQGNGVWRYRSPPGFRGADVVSIVARSGERTTTASVSLPVVLGHQTALGDPYRYVEISGNASYAFYGADASLVRRELASGDIDVASLDSATWSAVDVPRSSRLGHRVLFSASIEGRRDVFFHDFLTTTQRRLTDGLDPAVMRTYPYGNELGTSGRFAVVTTRADIVNPFDRNLNVYRVFLDTKNPRFEALTNVGPAFGGASLADSGTVVFATSAASVLGDGPGVVRFTVSPERVDQPVTGGAPTVPGTFPTISADGANIVFASTAVLTSTASADGRMRIYLSSNHVLSELFLAHVESPGDLRLARDGHIIAIRTDTALVAEDVDDGFDLYAYTIAEGTFTLLTGGGEGIPDGVDRYAVDESGKRYILRYDGATYLRSIW